MIDLHVHILPDVDDGSMDLEESLQMAQLAATSGVRGMAVTPHCNIPGLFHNYDSTAFRQQLKILQEALDERRISVKLYPGMEVFCRENLKELLEAKKLVALNDGSYMLAEFSFEEEPDWMNFMLEQIQDAGYIPLIAHPERYEAVKAEPQLAYEWVQSGCALQLNKDSVLGKFGRAEQRTAMQLLKHELVACIASDAHHANFRSPHMGEIVDFLLDNFGEGCVQLLLEDNPERILNSEPVVLLKPRGFRRRWFG